MWNERSVMGVEKPEKEPQSIDEMRQAIIRAQRDSAIVNRCLTHAEWQGLSGEDKYAMLAYYALRHLEDIYQQHMRLIALTPMPSSFRRETT